MALDKSSSSPLIFLCYAREDHNLVHSLYTLLKDLGLCPWMDKYDILAGKPWGDQIEEGVRNADFFIAFFSNISVKKQSFIQREYRLALDALLQKPPGSIFLIPVRLDDCQIPNLQNLGVKLSDIQWIDLFKKELLTESDIELILRAIEIQSEWRRPKTELLGIIKEYADHIDQSIIETLKVRDLPYTDKIISLRTDTSETDLLRLEEKAFKQYLAVSFAEAYKLGLESYYLIAQHLFRAISRNDFTICKHKPFIYPIHQYLSKMIRASEPVLNQQLISTLTDWLVSKESVYETSRDFSAFELGMSKSLESKNVLLDALDNPYELRLVRYYAAMALGMIRSTEPLNRLTGMHARERDQEIRKVIAHSIIYITNNSV